MKSEKNKKSKTKFYSKLKLFLVCSFGFLTVFSVSVTLICTLAYYFYHSYLPEFRFVPNNIWPYLTILISLIVGTLLSVFVTKEILVPVGRLRRAIKEVAEGDYTIKVKPVGIRVIRKLSMDFNRMVEKLLGVEILRKDFINNFSHEFKTPIVSLLGFAKMLKNDDITEEEREEYLSILISETERLSQLSTNVLNLSKIENQQGLSDVSCFNISEQIRTAVVLIDSRWAEKNMEFSFEAKEVSVEGNKEMLNQVWINLLDNAVKFSQNRGMITVSLFTDKDNVTVLIKDDGIGMNEETAKYAFERFYQGDSSHSTSGNGLGLPMAKKVCELHKGNIKIKSTGEKGTVFEVILPKKQ